MAQNVPQVTVEYAAKGISSETLLPGYIPGCTPCFHCIEKEKGITLDAGDYFHILFLISGEAEFITGGSSYCYDERVAFVPSRYETVEIKGKTDIGVLEIRWSLREGDEALEAEYKTEFPVVQLYRTSRQYVDPNKSPKTISRAIIWQRIIPRFCLGSVEAYGVDSIRAHDHPMLDQYFFSLPENEMDVIIDDIPVPMGGSQLMYIPLGAKHGIDVKEGQHCHYMWIDFYPDNDLALKRLDASHQPTGVYRDLAEEQIVKR